MAYVYCIKNKVVYSDPDYSCPNYENQTTVVVYYKKQMSYYNSATGQLTYYYIPAF